MRAGADGVRVCGMQPSNGRYFDGGMCNDRFVCGIVSLHVVMVVGWWLGKMIMNLEHDCKCN